MFMNELFKKVGAKKDTVRSGYDEIIEDEDAAMEYERSIVAYLGRHQAITAMVYCGLSEAEICACAGHEQIDTGVQPYDFVNPDTFRALADKLSRRPIVQIFDQMEDCCVVTFDGGQKSFTSDEGVRIVFQTDREKEFCLNAQSIEGNAPLKLGEVTNIQITKEVKMALPQCKENRTISIRQTLWKEGQRAYQAAKDGIEKSALEAVCAADESEWLDQAEDIDVQVHAPQGRVVSPLPDVQSLLPAVRIPNPARKTLNQPDEASVFSGAKLENQYQEEHLPGGATDYHMPKAGEKDERAEKGTGAKRIIPPVRYAESDKQLYVLDGRGELTRISNEQCKLYNPRSRGKKVVKSKQDAVALYTYRPDMLALLISKQGGVYRIPAGGLFCESPTSENTPYSDVLRDHGILLQDPNMTKAGASLICLMKSGRVIRLSLNIWRTAVWN